MENHSDHTVDERIRLAQENLKITHQLEIAALGVFPILASVALTIYNLPVIISGAAFCSLFGGTLLFWWHVRAKVRDFRLLIEALQEFRNGTIKEIPKIQPKNQGKNRLIVISASALYFSSFILTLSFAFIDDGMVIG